MPGIGPPIRGAMGTEYVSNLQRVPWHATALTSAGPPDAPLASARTDSPPPSPPGTARGAARADDATWPDEHELNGAGAAEHPEWTMYDNATDSVAETTSVVSDAASHAPGTE